VNSKVQNKIIKDSISAERYKNFYFQRILTNKQVLNDDFVKLGLDKDERKEFLL